MVFVNFLAWQEEGMKGVKAPWNESSHDFCLFFCQKLGLIVSPTVEGAPKPTQVDC